MARRQFLGFEVDDFWWFVHITGRYVHRCFRHAIRGPQRRGGKIKAAEPFSKSFEGRRVYSLAAVEDGVHAGEVKSVHVVV
ncbi:Uncharacterised protein [Mycobacterium tuberculosis]|uniref:Uncharacterized protein n=1 Tax=Mycobacterium tuberculosis TaxID=1773 RepID=A0A916L7P0_MYCTX|nr:Uncharacterised protein [Mycobacterium tuberculosis]